ncbi:hypothetical protein KIN20_023157 [Parelaphostrongylus tenuis]|uniref:Uncharacterized protein n=1 Tax=Parelaphostrongylus tenuis TaxID=148309 RepID=A0AAD5NC09_PARTN|nr:hypothetical protein KIN20_023157 [Parelaphostrongylus tenuis]
MISVKFCVIKWSERVLSKVKQVATDECNNARNLSLLRKQKCLHRYCETIALVDHNEDFMIYSISKSAYANREGTVTLVVEDEGRHRSMASG